MNKYVVVIKPIGHHTSGIVCKVDMDNDLIIVGEFPDVVVARQFCYLLNSTNSAQQISTISDIKVTLAR